MGTAGGPPAFVPDWMEIIFPPGTVMTENHITWALYVNAGLARTWIGYKTPGGTRIVPMGGVRASTLDMSRIDGFVNQRIAAACGACDD